MFIFFYAFCEQFTLFVSKCNFVYFNSIDEDFSLVVRSLVFLAVILNRRSLDLNKYQKSIILWKTLYTYFALMHLFLYFFVIFLLSESRHFILKLLLCHLVAFKPKNMLFFHRTKQILLLLEI